ncbi:very low-density lipoprotein receptor-like [Ptychodera flava]|uniref:very low-density lipoprotein receptor-like n=1 Tax=Ptychodera flava TaxID=63121 RepID=UPI00396A0C50
MNSTWKNSFCLLSIIIIIPGAVSPSPLKGVPDFKYDCAKPNMFNCTSGGNCVPEDHRCDGEPDCEDHSDEAGPCLLCQAPHTFMCEGKCQTKKMQCDGQQDCRDNEDEHDCCNILSDKEKVTREDGTCINKTLVCNRKDFWQGGSAEVEEICGTTTVPSATYAPIDVSSEITSQQPNSTPPSLKTPPGGPVNETTVQNSTTNDTSLKNLSYHGKISQHHLMVKQMIPDYLLE